MNTKTCFSNSGSNNECTLTSSASVEETWRTFAPVKALKASFGAFAGLLDFTLMDSSLTALSGAFFLFRGAFFCLSLVRKRARPAEREEEEQEEENIVLLLLYPCKSEYELGKKWEGKDFSFTDACTPL